MPETQAKKSKAAAETESEKQETVAQQEEETLDKTPLSTLLGQFISNAVRQRASFAASKQQFREWYDLVSAKQVDRKEFAKLVMQCCDTARLASEGLYSQAQEITSGDR